MKQIRRQFCYVLDIVEGVGVGVGAYLRDGRLLNAKPQREPKTREGRKENDDHSKEGEKSLRLVAFAKRVPEEGRGVCVSKIKLVQTRKKARRRS